MKSLVYIFTGEGKGKTSSALGMATRAICAGMKVAWVSWYKDKTWKVSEYKIKELLGVELIIGGKGFYFQDGDKVKKVNVGEVVDKVSRSTHKKTAQNTMSRAHELVTGQQYDVLILDEICQAVSQDLVSLDSVLALVRARGKTHLVLTGRDCPRGLIEVADVVTKMEKVKHAYDQGIMAIKGLDF